MEKFAVDPRLAADSHWIADWGLSQLRLMDDARYAWLVLVPRVAGAIEWIDLPEARQVQLLAEVNTAAALLRHPGDCDKLNIGALGNIVEQLHVHVIARRVGDAAWPGPVWGHGAAQRFDGHALSARLAALRERIAAAGSD